MKQIFLTGGIDFKHNNRGCQALSYGSLHFIDKVLGLKESQVIVPGFYIRHKAPDQVQKIDMDGYEKELLYRFYWLPGILLNVVLIKLFGKVLNLPFSRFYRDLREIQYILNISGGDSFSDIYGFKQFFVLAVPSLIAAFTKRKHVLLPQTIGPFAKPGNLAIARYILKRSDKVYVRDHEFVAQLDEMGIPYESAPDVSFYMNPSPVDVQFLPGTVGINISGLAYYNSYGDLRGSFPGYKELVVQIIKDFQQKNIPVCLVPHTYNFTNPEINSDDLAASIEVFNTLTSKDGVSVINGAYNAPQLKYIISRCDFFIGTRMHACFAAIFTKTPVFGLAYSYKFEGSFRRFGLRDCCSTITHLKTIEIPQILAAIQLVYSKKSFYKQELNKQFGSVAGK